jgi:hypothetical protein
MTITVFPNGARWRTSADPWREFRSWRVAVMWALEHGAQVVTVKF